MRLVAPFGFYGSGNIGDEATLLGFGRLIERFGGGVGVDVGSSNAAHTRLVEPAFNYYPYVDGILGLPAKLNAHRASAYIFPGGTPIMDGLGDWPLRSLGGMLEHARNWGKPAAFVGIGVEQLRHDISRQRVQEQIIPNVVHWSVRSVHDQDRLLDLGVAPERITVAADMAWLLQPADTAHGASVIAARGLGKRPLVGVNLNAEAHMLEKAPQIFAELAGALDDIIEAHGADILFLFNEVREEATFDQAAAEAVRTLMVRKDATHMGPTEYLTPQQMMSILSQCAMTLSTRYHFCIFSALQGIPFLAVKRSDKVSDLCRDLGWDGSVNPDAGRAEMTKIAAGLFGNPKPALERLAARIGELRTRSENNRIALDALISQMRPVRADAWLRTAAGKIGQKMGMGTK